MTDQVSSSSGSPLEDRIKAIEDRLFLIEGVCAFIRRQMDRVRVKHVEVITGLISELGKHK